MADIFINIPFNGEEGDFKDSEGSEVHQSDEIFGHRNWSWLNRGLTVFCRFQVVYINGILCEKSKMCCSSRFNA